MPLGSAEVGAGVRETPCASQLSVLPLGKGGKEVGQGEKLAEAMCTDSPPAPYCSCPTQVLDSILRANTKGQAHLPGVKAGLGLPGPRHRDSSGPIWLQWQQAQAILEKTGRED